MSASSTTDAPTLIKVTMSAKSVMPGADAGAGVGAGVDGTGVVCTTDVSTRRSTHDRTY